MTAIATTLVIPAIDLRDGAVVRLRQGDYDQQTTFPVDPLTLARRYRQAGASWLHVVDLDGARSGRFTHLALVAALAGEGLLVQAGGGIRDVDGVQALFDAGVERVVIGSVAVREPQKVAGWLQRFGAARLTLALDTRLRDGQWQLPHAGWTRTDGATLAELAPFYEAAGAVHLLCTDIDRDGMMSGPNLALYEHLAELAPRLALQVSGGVRGADDVRAAARVGAAGVILGRALLEAALTLEDAQAALSARPAEVASC
jgi:phosphoribosylformimino-5-aminoimidazole carboxamide ribotide isomerase